MEVQEKQKIKKSFELVYNLQKMFAAMLIGNTKY